MSRFVIDAVVNKGHIDIDNLPLPDLSKVKVLLFSEIDMDNMFFLRIKELTKGINESLSEKINLHRDER